MDNFFVSFILLVVFSSILLERWYLWVSPGMHRRGGDMMWNPLLFFFPIIVARASRRYYPCRLRQEGNEGAHRGAGSQETATLRRAPVFFFRCSGFHERRLSWILGGVERRGGGGCGAESPAGMDPCILYLQYVFFVVLGIVYVARVQK